MIEHSFPFDPTYGYTEARLRAIVPPVAPADFEAFWRQTYETALATPPRPTLRKVDSPRPQAVEVFEVEYDGIGGFRVGGWVIRPLGEKPVRGVVSGHGYGGREAPEWDVAGPAAITLFPCGRGFHRSARPDLPSDAAAHVVHGIEDRQTYLHRFCVADLWSGVSALAELFPEIAGNIDYMGTSFGGGIGAMALPWEKRFRRGYLGVPSFGNHPIRLTLPCVGSGESVRQYVAQHPQTRQVLQYFDSSISAQFCRIPVMVTCALFDPAVPPPGQFSVYNGLAGPKQLFIRQTDHFAWQDTPLEEKALFGQQAVWFSANGSLPKA